MGQVRPPVPDPTLEPFDDGVGVLTRDGHVAGHVATSLGWFWSPFRPLSKQWWVWLIVVWADGAREPSTEDYPPWTYVSEMQSGYFNWVGESRAGRYDFAWLPRGEAERTRAVLGIAPQDL